MSFLRTRSGKAAMFTPVSTKRSGVSKVVLAVMVAFPITKAMAVVVGKQAEFSFNTSAASMGRSSRINEHKPSLFPYYYYYYYNTTTTTTTTTISAISSTTSSSSFHQHHCHYYSLLSGHWQ